MAHLRKSHTPPCDELDGPSGRLGLHLGDADERVELVERAQRLCSARALRDTFTWLGIERLRRTAVSFASV